VTGEEWDGWSFASQLRTASADRRGLSAPRGSSVPRPDERDFDDLSKLHSGRAYVVAPFHTTH